MEPQQSHKIWATLDGMEFGLQVSSASIVQVGIATRDVAAISDFNPYIAFFFIFDDQFFLHLAFSFRVWV